jgi:outer membrane receptor protein involved in Fe transport
VTRRRLAKPLLGVLLGALAAARLPAASPEERELVTLDPEAVPLQALPLGDAPGATTVITAEEIARSAAANIFELLRRVPGVDIRYTPMGGHIGIRSNGSSPFSEQVLMLIDGSPYNSPDKGGFPGHPNYVGFFPMDRIARIEIVRGPISVVYGANAFGGVINIVSKQAADAVTNKIEGSAYGATVAAGTENLLEERIRAAWIRNGWDTSFEIGISDGNTPIQLNGDADHRRADLYAAVRRGNFSASYLHQENRNGPFPFLETQTQEAHHDVDILDAHYERRIGGFVVRAQASVNRYSGTTCAVCHNNQSAYPDDAVTDDVGDEREVDQREFLSLRADTTLTDSQDLSFGLVAAHDSVERDIVKIDGAPENLGSGGGYVQYGLHLAEGRLHLLAGVRGDYAEGLGSVASPRFALVGDPTENLTLRTSWSRAYRTPSWNERYIRQRFLPEDIFPGTVVILYGNPELDRERIDSAAVGASWRIHPDVVLRADLFHNHIHDFIYRNAPVTLFGTPSELRLVYENNAEPFTVEGGEIEIVTRPAPSVSLAIGYAYKSVGLPEDDPKAAYTSEDRGTLVFSWLPGDRWSFDLAASYCSEYAVSFPQVYGYRPQPSYVLADAALRYRFPVGSTRFELGLIGRNLFDEQPMETLVDDAVNTALRGRTMAVELRFDF